MTKQQKQPKRKRQLVIRGAIERYLMTTSPMRFHQTTAQIKASAKQMQQSGRVPVAVAQAIMQGVQDALQVEGSTAVGA